MSIREIPMNRVRITDAFWSPRQRLMTDVTIPYMEKILRDEVPGAENPMPSAISAWLRVKKPASFTAWCFRTAM